MTTTTNELRVKDVMSKHVVAISPADTLHEALELIVENRVSALPVVDGRERCVGMLWMMRSTTSADQKKADGRGCSRGSRRCLVRNESGSR